MTKLGTRLALLLGCLFAGLAIAFVGESLTGHQAWYLAIPALIAAGWLVVANPAKCEPQRRRDAP